MSRIAFDATLPKRTIEVLIREIGLLDERVNGNLKSEIRNSKQGTHLEEEKLKPNDFDHFLF
jgi:hypothetical protein